MKIFHRTTSSWVGGGEGRVGTAEQQKERERKAWTGEM